MTIILLIIFFILSALSFYGSQRYKKVLESEKFTPIYDYNEGEKIPDLGFSYRGGFREHNGTRVFYKCDYFFFFFYVETTESYRMIYNEQSNRYGPIINTFKAMKYYGKETPRKNEIRQLYWEHYSMIFLLISGSLLLLWVATSLLQHKGSTDPVDQMIERYNLQVE